MKLYTAKISPFAAICRMQIYTKNLDVEMLEVGEGASWDDVKAVNPLGKIPVLVVAGDAIPESTVICEYLEDCFALMPLRPEDASELALSRLIARISDQYLMANLVPLFAHLSRRHRDQAVVDDGLQKISRGLEALEHHLSGANFAAGSRMSLADCHLVPTLLFLEKYLPFFGVDQPFEDYEKVTQYWRAISDNPNASRVIAEINEGIAAKSAK